MVFSALWLCADSLLKLTAAANAGVNPINRDVRFASREGD